MEHETLANIIEQVFTAFLKDKENIIFLLGCYGLTSQVNFT